MNEGLARVGDAQERIGLRGDLADPRADREHQVGRLEARHQRRRRAGAEIADKAREAVVDDVLAAERAAHRQLVGLGKAGDVGGGGVAPAAAADQHDRPLGGGEQPAHFGEIGGAGMGMHGTVGADRPRRRARSRSMSSGKASTTGPGRPEVATWNAWLISSGMRSAMSICVTHLASGAYILRKSTSWKASRSIWWRATWPTSTTIGVESWNAVCTPIEALQAPGPARHQEHAGLAGQLAIGLGHEGGAALLAAGDEADLGGVEERVEHFEIALAGDAERHPDAMRAQRRDDQLAAAHQGKVRRHRRTARNRLEAAI